MNDERYYERRRRNNLAAKKSRDQRKFREEAVAQRAEMLERENAMLRAQVGGGLPSIISNILDSILFQSILYPSHRVRIRNKYILYHPLSLRYLRMLVRGWRQTFKRSKRKQETSRSRPNFDLQWPIKQVTVPSLKSIIKHC